MAAFVSPEQKRIYDKACASYKLETGKDIEDVIESAPNTFEELLALGTETNESLLASREKRRALAHSVSAVVGPIERLCAVAGMFASVKPFGRAAFGALSHFLKVAEDTSANFDAMGVLLKDTNVRIHSPCCLQSNI